MHTITMHTITMNYTINTITMNTKTICTHYQTTMNTITMHTITICRQTPSFKDFSIEAGILLRENGVPHAMLDIHVLFVCGLPDNNNMQQYSDKQDNS